MPTANKTSKSACLYVIATPIGNLEDLSPRAKRLLSEVDVIAAEDTRQAKKLLSLFAIPSPRELVSYHDHNEQEQAKKLIQRIKEGGLQLALITDAGTPCISDPGYRLTAEAHAQRIKVIPIPGPSALTALVSASGLPSDRVYFLGFLPNKESARKKELISWSRYEATSIVFFESLRRLKQTLKDLQDLYPTCQICIGRELTKLHEEVVSLTLQDALHWLSTVAVLRGEVSVMVKIASEEGSDAVNVDLRDKIAKQAKQAFKQGATLKSLLIEFKDGGLSRSELYTLLLDIKNQYS